MLFEEEEEEFFKNVGKFFIKYAKTSNQERKSTYTQIIF